ncbi:hypothetical protein BC629DRAFT_1654504 [Irpex lacteus]|nr:hypothetical protein BC629DRAFT_1654504 [Irpex lacteus]
MSPIQFTSLHNQAGLVSLEAARCNPSIVYRSLDIMYPSPAPAPTPAPIALPQTQGTFKLIPLAAAQAKAEIKYRSEGFEMKEARGWGGSTVICGAHCRILAGRSVIRFHDGGFSDTGEDVVDTGMCSFAGVDGSVNGGVRARSGLRGSFSRPTEDTARAEDRGLSAFLLQEVGWTWVGPPMVPYSAGLALEPSRHEVSSGASRGRAATRLSWCRPLRGLRDKYLGRGQSFDQPRTGKPTCTLITWLG